MQTLFAPVYQNVKPVKPFYSRVVGDFIEESTVYCGINGMNQVKTATIEQTFEINELGVMRLKYSVVFTFKFSKESESLVVPYGFTAETQLAVWSNIAPLPRWNAKTVINRLLVKAETLRKSQTPRFHLNAEQAEEFEKIEMPELH